ncbi:MAG: aconitate hydratase AcnA [Rhodospirillales bacterium]
MAMQTDVFGAKKTLETKGGRVGYFDIGELEKQGIGPVSTLPYSIKICLENMLRNVDGRIITEDDVKRSANWQDTRGSLTYPLRMSRVMLPDAAGIPSFMDLVGMREKIERLGGDASGVNPAVHTDLILDHSVTADFFGAGDSMEKNVAKEFERNAERYRFCKWVRQAFDNVSVLPPGLGICHQINLEYLGRVVMAKRSGNETLAYPDSLVACDSHTPMINGIGILGWGVGGIEAEVVMLGQPYFLPAPEVVGVKMHGDLRPGVTATDLVLSITERLREVGVTSAFVEYFGPGVKQLSIPDRATIANMAPEYGATMGFFPVDAITLEYLEMTGRGGDHKDLVERYTKANGLFANGGPAADCTRLVDFDMSKVEASVAGPKRPQDRVSVYDIKRSFRDYLTKPVDKRGYGLDAAEAARTVTATVNGTKAEVGHGMLAIASITSCTNTSNPSLLMGAGLLARNAAAAGLKAKPWVKTSLSPGSQVVTAYLEKAGLMDDLEALGFYLVGYGCMTCGGKSGPLPEDVVKVIEDNKLVATAVLSANRNFEGRTHPYVRGAYLASPPLVVAFALAGRADIDFKTEPLGRDEDGKDVYLADIWPSPEEIRKTINDNLNAQMFQDAYAKALEGTDLWKKLDVPTGPIFKYDPDSSYILPPPWFDLRADDYAWPDEIKGARVLGMYGDSLTTDHVTPGGYFPKNGASAQYMQSLGIAEKDFNTVTQRRGNHHVMERVIFANVRIKNLVVPGSEGDVTRKFPEDEKMFMSEAARKYRAEGTPMIVIGAKDYGMGSSRDWAAKGPALLGIGAIIANSFERIHRSNLIGMGVVPLLFADGEGYESLGLTGEETFDIAGLDAGITDGAAITVTATAPSSLGGKVTTFEVKADVRSPYETDCLKNGGVLLKVMRAFMAEGAAA